MIKRYILSFVIALIAATGLFVLVAPTLAQLMLGEEAIFSTYLVDNDVEVGNESVDGYNQVYYVYQNEKRFITERGVNSTLPHTAGEYIAYRKALSGGDQIFLHHLTTGRTIQLTSSGNNTNPKVSRNGRVVWESWITDGWQIFLFDGLKIIQLTSGDLSINPDIEGDYVVFSRRDIAGTYRSVVYSISKGEAKEVMTGIGSKRPELASGIIFLLGAGREEFPLKAEDFFVLDLDPLTTQDMPVTVDEQDILHELAATPSAAVEKEVSPTPVQDTE